MNIGAGIYDSMTWPELLFFLGGGFQLFRDCEDLLFELFDLGLQFIRCFPLFHSNALHKGVALHFDFFHGAGDKP